MKKILSILLILLTISINAQEVKLSGKVIDAVNKKALQNVNVIIVNSKYGTATDQNGKFEIQATKNSILRFSYVGYKSIDLKANNLPQVIQLSPNNKLKEVVISIDNTNQETTIDSKEFNPSLQLSFTDTEEHLIAKTANDITLRKYTTYYSMLPERAGLPKFPGGEVPTPSDAFAKWKRIGVITFDERNKDVAGSPYLNEKFSNGKIYLSDKSSLLLVNLRFNVLANQFEVKLDNKIVGVNKESVDYITLDKKVYKPYYNQAFENKYFEIIGKYKDTYLLKYNFAKKSEDVYAEGISIGNHTVRISKFAEYFLKKSESEVLTPIKLKKKNINKIFGKEKTIKEFISKNKLKMKNEDDYKKVYTHLYKL